MGDDEADAGRDGGFAERLGARTEVADDGSARLAFTAREEHLNRSGTLHGGVLATLVDTAMGAAVRSAVGDGDVPATSHPLPLRNVTRPDVPAPSLDAEAALAAAPASEGGRFLVPRILDED